MKASIIIYYIKFYYLNYDLILFLDLMLKRFIQDK